MPIIAWGVLGLGGVLGVGWAAKESANTVDAMARLTKWAAVGGGLYLTYSTLKKTGAI